MIIYQNLKDYQFHRLHSVWLKGLRTIILSRNSEYVNTTPASHWTKLWGSNRCKLLTQYSCFSYIKFKGMALFYFSWKIILGGSMSVHIKLLQSCPTLCDPMDYSSLGYSDHGILQARILEWIAMPSCKGSSRPRNQTRVSYVSFIGGQVLYR